MPKRPLADGALELLPLRAPASILKRPFVDGALDVVLPEDPNLEKPAMLDVPLGTSLFAVVPKGLPVELAFEMLSLADMTVEPNRPPVGVAFETSLSKDVACELNPWPGDGVLDVSLLGYTPLKPEKPPAVDEGFIVPNGLLGKED